MSTDEKWYFTEEQLANTPSRKCGIDAVKELKYRQQAANFIQDMGQRLLVFYVFHSFSQFHKNSIATAALFLAAKVEEQPQTLEHVINIAFICFHKDQQQLPKVRSEQNMEQVDDLLFNENVLLQTLGFDVGIDHPHTHIVSCCHLLKASKDLAQASYFTASNSLHLTTMCLQYKPTLVACFCIHLACKWSNLEIPQSNEGKPWFWYVDPSITARQLEQLTSKFLHTFDRCQSKLNRRVKSESAKQSPSLNHSSLTNSPFDDGPPQVNVPKEGAPPSLTCPFSAEEPIKLPVQTFPFSSTSSRPIADYREAKERERLKREKAACVTNATRTSIESILKSHSHSHQNSQKMSKQTSNNMREQTSNIGDAPRELIKLEAKIEQGIRIEGGIEIEQNGNWENSKTMEMLGRVSKLIHPIRDKPTSTNGRVDAHNATSSVSNDLKPSEIIKPFETEPIMRQPHLSNGFDLMMNREEGIKIETDDSGISSTFMCRNSRDYLSPMKSAQSINALLQKPFDPMPSLLQEIGDCIAQQTSSQVQDTHHHGGRSSQYGDTLDSWKNEDKQKNIAGSYPQSSQLIGSAVKCEKVVLSTVDISPLAVPQQRIPETNPLASAKQMANPSQNPRNIVQTIPRNTENTIIPCLRAPTPTHATGKPVTTTVSMTTTARISKHHKRYKNKKEKKHKHKGKDKPRNKRKHKNEVKEKENHIKMKIPKDKLNLTSKTGTTTTQWQICDPQITSEKKSPQTGLKIKIPKAKLKVTESNSQTLAQAPLKIKIRNDGSSVIGENFKTSASVNTDSTRKRNRGVFVGSGDASSAAPPTKKPHHHPQEATTTTVGQIQGTTTSYPLQQSLQQGQRQNDRHYSSNNKEKYPWSHQESSNKLSQQQFVLLHQ